MTVTLEEYMKKMNPHGEFQIIVSAKNLDTGRLNIKDTTFSLMKPVVFIEVRLSEMNTSNTCT